MEQSNQKTKLLAALHAFATTCQPATIASDSKHVVDGWRRHITNKQPWKTNSDHLDLWEPLQTAVNAANALAHETNPTLQIRKVKGYARLEHVSSGTITLQDMPGNHAVDKLATYALTQHPASQIPIHTTAKLREKPPGHKR